MQEKNNMAVQNYSMLNFDDEIKNKIEIIKRAGLSSEKAYKLLKILPSLFFIDEEEIIKRLSFIYNGEELYAIIYCCNNYYEWTIYNNKTGEFSELKCSTYVFNKLSNDENYMIRSIIDSSRRRDLENFINVNVDDTLEDKIYKIKQLKMNHNGFRII